MANRSRRRTGARTSKKAARTPRTTAGFRFLARFTGLILLSGVVIAVIASVALGAYMMQLDKTIRAEFEGKRWALPARVYARALELYPGASLSADALEEELGVLHYWSVERLLRPGSFRRDGQSIDVYTRSFDFWDGEEPSRKIRIRFDGETVVGVTALESGEDLGIIRMEPAEIAMIHPAHHEDRILVKHEEIPPVLIDALLAVEDRQFYDHFGIHPKGILRAAWANFRAGRTVQGGSTLTQQLVKNFFLTNAQTYERKFKEILMAILVDWNYDKEAILEAYANEVYLGQDGSRAIHGMGLASRYYFGRPLAELNLHHAAMLVGLVRGPSIYDPRRKPEAAKARRALVLDLMVGQNLISRADAETAKQLPLDVIEEPPSGLTAYPAFVDLVQRQLKSGYRQEDLVSEGLKIFTTLDLQVQSAAEQAIVDKLPELEKSKGLSEGSLQSAAIVADPQTGEIQAIVGGRDVQLAGFNRALDAQRQPGSLLKGPIYLSALEYPSRYTLSTLLDDTQPVEYTTQDGQRWAPGNYDKQFHGYVMLRDALARSLNIPTVRVGLDLDVLTVIDTLKRLGLNRDLKPYPSLLLGAIDITVLEVAQMYGAFASGGYNIPLRAIREVTTAEGEPLSRYPLEAVKVIEPAPAFLITQGLQRVVAAGTAASAYRTLDRDLGLAGKTGTTDDYRDSWFAGFSGNRLAVVWVGRDDNKPMKLSGSSGALPVWVDLMNRIPLTPVDLSPPSSIEWVSVDPYSGMLADVGCPDAQTLPFIAGSAPAYLAPCSQAYYPVEPMAQAPYDRGMPQNDPFAGPGGPSEYQPVPPRPPANDNAIDNFFRRLTQ